MPHPDAPTYIRFEPGKNPVFVKELMHSFASCSIDCKLMSEERFRLADYKLP